MYIVIVYDSNRLNLFDKMNKQKLFHYSSSSSRSSDVDSDSTSSSSMNIDTKYKAKTNPCIKRLLKEIPTRKSFESTSSSRDEDRFDDFNEEDDHIIHHHHPHKKQKLEFGKIRDDYFVIDDIQKQPFYPREDGYELTYDDKKNADKQPYGKEYYKDQLLRIKIMNDNNQYTFIKFIAGAMGRSPYDLLDPEDMDRVQQEKEESRQRTQLEMKRRIVTVDKKEKQLKTLNDALSNALAKKKDLNLQLQNADKETFDEIDDLLNNAKIDVLSDLCDIYDDYNDEENVYNPAYYSYTNILELLRLFNPNDLSDSLKTSIVNEISERNDLSLTSQDDVHGMYLFSLYWLYHGHPSSDLIFKRLLRDTIKHYIDSNSSKLDDLDSLFRELDIEKPIKLTSCSPLLVHEVFLNTNFFKDSKKVALRGCILLLGETKSVSVRDFINQTGSYDKYVIQDDKNLLDELRYMYKDWSEVGNSKDDKRTILIQYFIYKFIQKSKWNAIKDELNLNAFDMMNNFISSQLDRVKTLKSKVFNPYIIRRGPYIQSFMNGNIISISPFISDKTNLDAFDKEFRRNSFYTKDIRDAKFKRYIEEDLSNKRDDANDLFKGLTPTHQWLDLYLRYYRFIQHNNTKIDKSIAKLEESIDKTRKIIITISNEEGLGIKDIDGDWIRPEYKQKKSFTSQPSINGIVKVKEEVITFINKTYTLIQQVCPGLKGLPFEEFYSKQAIEDTGLCCDFALCIAAEIAKNHVLFPETYKSQHHNRFVVKSAIDAMAHMKKYSYSALIGNKYIIHVNNDYIKHSLQRRINDNYEPLFQQIHSPNTYSGGTRLVMF